MQLVRALLLSMPLVGCVEAEPEGPPPPKEEPNAPQPEPPPVTDTGEEPEEPEEPPGPDCSVLPPVPVWFHTLHGFGDAEDFDIDGQGFHGSVIGGNLVLKDRFGEQQLLSPNVTLWSAGTRVLPSGDWVVNDANNGAVVLVDGASGARSVILAGLEYPNGLEVDRKGQVYVAEQTSGRVQTVDPATLASQVIAQSLNQPNGLILSPDEQTLYVGSFGAGHVYAIPRTGPNSWGPAQILWQPPPGGEINGMFDGINVDICGNIYITEYVAGRVWRITPDGQQHDLVAELPSHWIPNMRWGHGIGNWAADVLYVSDRDEGRIFGLQMLIPGKKHVLAK